MKLAIRKTTNTKSIEGCQLHYPGKRQEKKTIRKLSLLSKIILNYIGCSVKERHIHPKLIRFDHDL